MNEDPASIRKFLTKYFSDEELETLCFDYFPEVKDDFTLGMVKSQKVLLLIGYCQRRGQVASLMAALERERPQTFPKHFAPKRSATLQTPEPQDSRVHNARQIFISHASQDAQLAHQLAGDLEAHGWVVWIAPDNIHPGEKWVEAISRGLDGSGVFVLLLTEHAVKSRWVRDETNVAIELQNEGSMQFVPLQIRQCHLPALWRAYQRIPFRAGYDIGLEQLLAALDPSTVVSSPPMRPNVQVAKPKPQPPVILNQRTHAQSGLELLRVPAGKFLYGDDKKELELPEFWISKTPVTNADYARFVLSTGYKKPSHWGGNSRPPQKIADHPVVNVPWHDANAYADWAGLRLPTEQEWEKAARGTDGREYPWGDWADGRCNSREAGTGSTSSVGQFSPQGDSPYGCVDMSGNVWEWTNSWHNSKGKFRSFLRGGAFDDHYQYTRTSYRLEDFILHDRGNSIGFRVVEHLSKYFS